MSRIQLGDISVDVAQKNIRNVHLSVYPPTGRVRISAPLQMSLDTIRAFAISKIDWIRNQRTKFMKQERETPREYLDGESHYLWGARYLLRITERDQAPAVALERGRITLTMRAGASEAAKEAVIAEWYREQVKATASELILKWQPIFAVRVERVLVQQMKTKWGSCNPRARNIRLNTELAKKPKECIEYIVMHEMVHLLEPNHSARFVALMDQFMPLWKTRRESLNDLPVRHAEWDY